MPKERKPGKKGKDKPNEPFIAHLPAAPGASDIPPAIPEEEEDRSAPESEPEAWEPSPSLLREHRGEIKNMLLAHLKLETPYLASAVEKGDLTLQEALAEQIENDYVTLGGRDSKEAIEQDERTEIRLETELAKMGRGGLPNDSDVEKEIEGVQELLKKLDSQALDPYQGVAIDPDSGRIRRGPKTANGKAAIRLNALKHGLVSKEAFIAGEDVGDFIGLSEALRDDLAPKTATEDMLVERIISSTWRLRRALTAERLMMNNRTLSEFRGLPNYKGAHEGLIPSDEFQKLMRYETSIERGLYRALVMLQGLQEKRMRQPAGGMGLAELVEAMVSSPLGQSSPQPAPDGDGPQDGTGPIEPAAPHGPIDPEVDP